MDLWVVVIATPTPWHGVLLAELSARGRYLLIQDELRTKVPCIW